MREIPNDAEPLGVENAYAYTPTGASYGSHPFFLLLQRENHIQMFRVGEVQLPSPPGYRMPRVYDLRCQLRTSNLSNVSVDFAKACTEIQGLMVSFAAAVEESYSALRRQAEAAEAEENRKAEELRRQYQREIEARRKAAEREKLQRAARSKHLFDLMKWHPGERIRCTRTGYRSTVFGTIDRVDERGLHITTEKNKYMFVEFALLNKLQLRDPDNPRKYEDLYKLGDEPDVTETEEEAVT